MLQPLVLAALVAAAPVAPAVAPAPPSPRRPVVDTHHGVKVVDDDRWLESADDPAVRAWTEAQNAHTRAVLDAVPGREALRARVAELVRSTATRHRGLVERGGVLFALKGDPRAQQPVLVALRSLDDAAGDRTVLDPNALDAQGAVTIDFFAPSLDGRKVAVSLSRLGSELGDLHVYDVATGAEVGEPIPHVHDATAGGSVAWDADGTGFWYTRYPRGEERPPADRSFFQQVWYHRLGTPTAQDVEELGKELPRIAEVALQTKRDGRWVVAEVRNGDGGEVAIWLRATGRGGWTRLADFPDQVVKAQFGVDDALYVLARKGSPRGRILRLPLARPSTAEARLVVPEGRGAIQDFLPTESRIYVDAIEGGPSRLRVVELGGKSRPDVAILPVSSVGPMVRIGGDDIVFESESYLQPPAWYRLDADSGAVTRTRLAQPATVDLSDAEVVRELATSKDGTRVPVTIVRRRGTPLDGRNPALLYAYGGYGISQTPRFSPLLRLWLDHGAVWAVAHVRGGGEFGEPWHLAGNLTRKQNGFDDFFAAARLLFDRRYTRPARLAIMGGSNGGLLMGAALTQHPELFRAVVSAVGVYDMLRVETTPNGAFNVTEFGTVKDPAQFRALHAYSPYHRVRAGVRYPAVLLTTGQHDARVDPWHSRKFAAALQRASASGRPVLLRTSDRAGHGIGSAQDEVVALRADTYAFLLSELGVPFRAPPAAPAR